jgi:hypothetical protein
LSAPPAGVECGEAGALGFYYHKHAPTCMHVRRSDDP